MSFRLASGVIPRESEGGLFLVADRPLRAVRVNEALFRLVSAPVSLRPRTNAEARALGALARAGYLESEPEAGAQERAWPLVTVVIPVKDRADELRRCLLSLARVRYPEDRLEVVVVDDGSTDPSAAVARSLGARVVPSGGRPSRRPAGSGRGCTWGRMWT